MFFLRTNSYVYSYSHWAHCVSLRPNKCVKFISPFPESDYFETSRQSSVLPSAAFQVNRSKHQSISLLQHACTMFFVFVFTKKNVVQGRFTEQAVKGSLPGMPWSRSHMYSFTPGRCSVLQSGSAGTWAGPLKLLGLKALLKGTSVVVMTKREALPFTFNNRTTSLCASSRGILQ